MKNDGETTSGSDFKDRKTGLVVFGILEILFGALCALIVPLVIVGMLASAAHGKDSASQASAGTMIPGLLFYILLAAWFIWMGIGSILARRWARALFLVTSWPWLASGILGLFFILVLMPDFFAQMSQSEQMSKNIAAVIKYTTIGFMAVFYVIMPGALILFYGSRHVKATCERINPRICWTDKCPLPVLGVSLVSLFCAASVPLMGFYGWAVPFFGIILSGIGGAGVMLVILALLVYVAWGMYRLSIKAWGCAVFLTIAWGASTCITFSRVNLMEFYEKMNFNAQQLEMMKHFTLPRTSLMLLFCGFWVAIVLAYLFYIKRYLTPPAEQLSVSPGTSI